MIKRRGGPFRPLLEATDQGHHPLLQAHAVHQPVLVGFEGLALEGILQPRRLQFIQPLLVPLAFLLQPLAVAPGPLQGSLCLLPVPLGAAGWFQARQQGVVAEAIQPAALLPGPGQLLGLTLNRELQQQRPQFQQLGAADDHTVDAAAAADAFLKAAPLATDHQLLLTRVQLLLPEPIV